MVVDDFLSGDLEFSTVLPHNYSQANIITQSLSAVLIWNFMHDKFSGPHQRNYSFHQ